MSREVVTLAKKTKGEYSYNEAIKTLRTNVQFCGSNLRRILLTSAFPDEGKSDVTFALASSLAQIGKKVILIDADIRKSVMVSRYQVETEINGLSQYLTGQREMEEVIYNTNFEGLSIIFAGPYSPNPSELLEEDLFHELLDALDEKFDYIISKAGDNILAANAKYDITKDVVNGLNKRYKQNPEMAEKISGKSKE